MYAISCPLVIALSCCAGSPAEVSGRFISTKTGRMRRFMSRPRISGWIGGLGRRIGFVLPGCLLSQWRLPDGMPGLSRPSGLGMRWRSCLAARNLILLGGFSGRFWGIVRVRSRIGGLLIDGFFSLVFLAGFWSIRVAPVRGSTYFSLPPQRKVGKRKRLTPLIFKRLPHITPRRGSSGIRVLAHSTTVTQPSFIHPRALRSGGRFTPVRLAASLVSVGLLGTLVSMVFLVFLAFLRFSRFFYLSGFLS
nr:hypothetical protein HUO10_000421 [Paraburkholderia busanensis]